LNLGTSQLIIFDTSFSLNDNEKPRHILSWF
jgi:hypothetical protein